VNVPQFTAGLSLYRSPTVYHEFPAAEIQTRPEVEIVRIRPIPPIQIPTGGLPSSDCETNCSNNCASSCADAGDTSSQSYSFCFNSCYNGCIPYCSGGSGGGATGALCGSESNYQACLQWNQTHNFPKLPCNLWFRCQSGAACCSGICTDLQLNPSNCGRCGNVCPTGSICCNGVCMNCPSGTNCCNGACVDLKTSSQNCGICGNTCCQGGCSCVNGVCSCPTGQTDCNGSCTSLSTDPNNCGQCGNSCPGGQVCCGGACVSLATSQNNCGACGIACGGYQNCCGGTCQNLLPSPTGTFPSNDNAFECFLSAGGCANFCSATVMLVVTDDLNSSAGFSLQLNALSPPGVSASQPVSQQYAIQVSGTTITGIVNNWINHTTAGTFDTLAVCDYVPLGSTPISNGLPEQYTLYIQLQCASDGSGNIGSVLFQVTDQDDNVVGRQNINLSQVGCDDSSGSACSTGANCASPSGGLAPIAGFALDLVGAGGGNSTTFSSGSGVLTYDVTSPNGGAMTPQTAPPANCVATALAKTAETSNVIYGLVPPCPQGIWNQGFNT
jgi:hypothetical protein